jgi:hypothetical protein
MDCLVAARPQLTGARPVGIIPRAHAARLVSPLGGRRPLNPEKGIHGRHQRRYAGPPLCR